jgi:hypothetical protein
MPCFSSEDAAIILRQENKILIIRTTLLLIDALLTALEKKNPFILPVLTAPALLQTNARPKRARRQTLDYKTMHKSKQNQPEQGKETKE